MVAPKKKDDEKGAETTDLFLLASMMRYKLTEYPDPVSFSEPRYVVTVKLWPGFLLMTGVKWEMVETEHDLPGPLLQSFQAALSREFPDQCVSHRKLMSTSWSISKRWQTLSSITTRSVGP